MDADEDGEVAVALAVLRDATRESAERRLALCTPLSLPLSASLLITQHASLVDATAAWSTSHLSGEQKGARLPVCASSSAQALGSARATLGALDWHSMRRTACRHRAYASLDL
ncbi:hypothetical protein ZWY2020_053647 [Hordeum vulgare]|nr:hypothetical protein ZWY2020_053647 [Hordeum vulgare]